MPTLRIVVDLPGLTRDNFTEPVLVNMTGILANAANLTVNDTFIVSVDDIVAQNSTGGNITLTRLIVVVSRLWS